MRVKEAIPRTARVWWWGFGLLIGIPVTVLAVLGLRMVDLERVQRRQQVAEQQSQTALLVDTSVGAMLNRIERDLAQPGLEGGGGTPFTLDRAGSLVLPSDRVYFAEIGSEPAVRKIELPAGVRGDVERAQAAEAQGNSAEATLCYKRLSNDARLRAWAALALARMDMRQRPEALLAWAGATNQDWDAMSPTGVSVALVAASYTEQLPLSRRAEFAAFLRAALDHLRSGAWWLSYEERKVQDAELRRLIGSTGILEPPVDGRISEISLIERAVRLAPLRRDIAVRSLIGSPEPLLVFGVPDPGEQSRWKG